MRSLLIRGGAVGDFVLTLPLVDSLRAADPDGKVEILGNPDIVSLAAAPGGAVTAKFRVSDARFACLFSETALFSAAEGEYFASFGLVVCVWPDDDGAMRRNLERVCRGKVVMIDPRPAGHHATDCILLQAARAGLPVVRRMPLVLAQDREKTWASEWTARENLRRPLLIIHMGSGGTRKNWPAERFAQVGRLWERFGGSVAVTVGPVEEDLGTVGSVDWNGKPPVLIRNCPLPRVAAVLAHCDAYLGNDSGITHLAAAAGAPTVALFGPTDPCLWAPRGRKVQIVEDAIGRNATDVFRVLEALVR